MTQPAQTEKGRFADLRFILGGNRRALAVLATLSVITAVSETFLLAAIVQAVSAMSGGRTTVELNLGALNLETGVVTLLSLAVAAAVIRAVLSGYIAIRGPRVTGNSRERHRRRLFESYLSASWSTQSADKSGRLLQTVIGSVNDANTVISLLTQALPAFLTLIVLIGVSLVLSPAITLCLLALAVTVGAALRPLSRLARTRAREDAAGRNATASHISGVMKAGAEIAVLGARPGVVREGRERIRAADRAYGRSVGLKRLVSVSGQSLAFLFAACGLLMLSATGADVDFATVGTIAVLLLRGAGLAQQVQMTTSQFGSVAPFIEQIRTVIAEFEASKPAYGTEDFPTVFDVNFEDVTYTYPGASAPTITVPTAVFPAGSSTAIVGPSGSGKSTLAQLILRLRAPSTGRLFIGDVDVTSINETQFSKHVAYVPQTPTLIPGTIEDNIRFFRPDIESEQVIKAARLAHVHADIASMPAGYDTVLDSHVDGLSGGQKQRLALARALVGAPSVIVLDEPTSALDATNEQAVIETLHQLRGRTTIIMITHKVSSAGQCDQIIRVERGLAAIPLSQSDRPPTTEQTDAVGILPPLS